MCCPHSSSSSQAFRGWQPPLASNLAASLGEIVSQRHMEASKGGPAGSCAAPRAQPSPGPTCSAPRGRGWPAPGGRERDGQPQWIVNKMAMSQ